MGLPLSGLINRPIFSAKEDVTGIILAGGQGKRMNMADKGLQLLDGQPMVSHVINRIKPQVGHLMINANRNIKAYSAFHLPVYSDEKPLFFLGPLAGFLTGLHYCKTPYLVTVPCDTPFVSDWLVKYLRQSLEEERADLSVAVTKNDECCRVQSVFCLMKSSLKLHVESFLKQGGRKIDKWYSSLKVAEAYFSDLRAFENINTLEELERLQNPHL